MKIPEPRTLRGAVSPMIIVNWIFAIGIFEYPIGHPRPMISLCWSIAHFITFLGLVILAGSRDVSQMQHSTVSVGTYGLFSLASVLYVIVILCLGRIASKHILASLQKLNELNKMLSKYGIPKEYGLTFRHQIFELIGVFLFMTTPLAVNTFWIIQVRDFRRTDFGYLAFGYYRLACSTIVDYTFISLIRYIGNRFRHLNANLVQYSSQENDTNSFPQGLELDDSFQPTILRIHAEPYFFRSIDEKLLVQLICDSRKIHQELCSTATILNEAFGIQILLSITISSILITASFYAMYQILVNSAVVWTDTSIINIIIITFLLVLNTMKVLYLISVCSMTSAQANRMGEVIHQLDKPTIGRHVRDEIYAFSLLLMQNPLRFTASGFFSLDYQMIRSIVGTVTTYLIIMIQLHNFYDPASVSNNDRLSSTNATNATY